MATASQPLTRREALLARKRAIDTELRALEVAERTRRRRAETRGKIILGSALLQHAECIPSVVATLAARDLEFLRELGWLSENPHAPSPAP